MTDLAIYDMDRTVTRRATYTPFLLHCAAQRARWRLAFAPAVALSMTAYGLKAIDRARLKEINHRLLLGYALSDDDLKPLVESFAEKTIRDNIQPGAVRAIARDRAEGRRLVMATASYALYVDAIAERLGFDDVIATRSRTGWRSSRSSAAMCASTPTITRMRRPSSGRMRRWQSIPAGGCGRWPVSAGGGSRIGVANSSPSWLGEGNRDAQRRGGGAERSEEDGPARALPGYASLRRPSTMLRMVPLP